MIPATLTVLAAFLAPSEITPVVSDGAVLSEAQQWQLIESTARMRTDGTQNSVSTAVAVGVRANRLYLLTAYHAFNADKRYEFEFYSKATFPRPTFTIPATSPISLVATSKLADFVLLSVALDAEQAPPPLLQLVKPLDRPKRFPFDVMSVGCSNGLVPTARQEEVQARRVVKRDATEVAFFWETNLAPNTGRSGGPLVDARGKLIGLCTAASRAKGYYTHADELHAELIHAGCEWLWSDSANDRNP